MNPTIPDHVIRDALAPRTSRRRYRGRRCRRQRGCESASATICGRDTEGALPTRLMPLVTAQAICISSLTRRRIAKSVAALKQLLFTP